MGFCQRAVLGVPLLAILVATASLDDDCNNPHSEDELKVSLLQLGSAFQQQTNTGTELFSRWEKEIHVKNSPPRPPPWRARPACDVSPWTKACKPGFMVIGVQKSGTSTLYHIMATHPQISPASKKELLWFNGNFEQVNCAQPNVNPTSRSFSQYLRRFPRLNPHSDAVTGEFSATYFHCYCCPAAFKRLMPNIRLVVQLRDPIERARSRYLEQQALHQPWARGSFEDYVDRELPQLKRCMSQAHTNDEKQLHCAGKHNVLGLSLYDAGMNVWQRHFQPEDLLVTYLDHLAEAPQEVLTAIHAHLGLRNYTYGTELYSTYNSEGGYGWNVASTIQVDSRRAMSKLYDFYRPHMQALQGLARAGRITPLPESWLRRWDL